MRWYRVPPADRVLLKAALFGAAAGTAAFAVALVVSVTFTWFPAAVAPAFVGAVFGYLVFLYFVLAPFPPAADRAIAAVTICTPVLPQPALSAESPPSAKPAHPKPTSPALLLPPFRPHASHSDSAVNCLHTSPVLRRSTPASFPPLSPQSGSRPVLVARPPANPSLQLPVRRRVAGAQPLGGPADASPFSLPLLPFSRGRATVAAARSF